MLFPVEQELYPVSFFYMGFLVTVPLSHDNKLLRHIINRICPRPFSAMETSANLGKGSK